MPALPDFWQVRHSRLGAVPVRTKDWTNCNSSFDLMCAASSLEHKPHKGEGEPAQRTYRPHTDTIEQLAPETAGWLYPPQKIRRLAHDATPRQLAAQGIRSAHCGCLQVCVAVLAAAWRENGRYTYCPLSTMEFQTSLSPVPREPGPAATQTCSGCPSSKAQPLSFACRPTQPASRSLGSRRLLSSALP